MACEANSETVALLQARGKDIISGRKPRRSISSRSTSRDNDEGTTAEDWGTAMAESQLKRRQES